MSGEPVGAVTVLPVDGIGEVRQGDDLAALVAAALPLRDGDVVVLTSKVVSKAEGQVRRGGREEHLAAETVRVVARRGPTSIVRTRHGLVVAAAGIDDSNVEVGSVVLLPRDPDASAQRMREALARRTGRNVAVVVTDTAGRAWRTGQTDVAVGAAGLEVVDDHAGRTDPYGNLLAVTAPAVADELAAAADLVKGKLAGRPAAVVRGLAHVVLDRGRHGPGAAALVRPEDSDMFGLGSREAVLTALGSAGSMQAAFGAPAPPAALLEALSALPGCGDAAVEGGTLRVRLVGAARDVGAAEARVTAAAYALGWLPRPGPGVGTGPAAASGTASGIGTLEVLLSFRAATP